jgi:hypothetical protein
MNLEQSKFTFSLGSKAWPLSVEFDKLNIDRGYLRTEREAIHVYQRRDVSKKVKLSMQQAVEAHRDVKRRDSHIF